MNVLSSDRRSGVNTVLDVLLNLFIAPCKPSILPPFTLPCPRQTGHINLTTLRHDPGRTHHTITAHTKSVSCLALQPDELGVLSGGADGDTKACSKSTCVCYWQGNSLRLFRVLRPPVLFTATFLLDGMNRLFSNGISTPDKWCACTAHHGTRGATHKRSCH